MRENSCKQKTDQNTVSVSSKSGSQWFVIRGRNGKFSETTQMGTVGRALDNCCLAS